MGRAVVYCSKCQTRLTGAEFESGKAFEGAGVFACAPCVEKLPPEQREAFRRPAPEPAPPPEPAPLPHPARKGSTVRIPRASGSQTPVWPFALGGAAVLLIVALIALSVDSSSPPSRPKTDPEPAAAAGPPPEPPAEPKPERSREPREEVRPRPERVAPREAPAPAPAPPPPVPAPPPPPPSPPPAPAPPPPPPKLYPPVWAKALPLAAARDYDRAIAEIERAALQDPAERAEAADDLDRLRRARAMLAETFELLAKWPAGRKLQVTALDEKSAPRAVDASTVDAGPGWLEVKKEKETFFVPAGEILPPSLAELYKARVKDPDAKGAAAFLVLEGDGEAARRLFGAEALPPEKFGSAPRPAETAAREAEARRLLYAALEADRDLQEGQRRAGSVERYAALQTVYAGTGVGRRNRELIARRAEPAREYLFLADDLRAAGGFRPSSAEKVGACWTVPAEAKETFLEFEILAAADTAYRGWVYAGACCAENFRLVLHADPEAPVALKPPSTGLPRAHAPHAAGGEPPRWGWVSFSLPKGPAGRRKIRLVAERAGVAVAYGMVSSARQSAPSDALMKELRRSQPEAAASAAPLREPGLVGYWKFDEGSGAAAGDSSGNGHHGKLMEGTTWVPGKVGMALQFDGVKGHVVVPDTPALRLPGDLSVAFWMKKTSEPSEYQRLVGKGDATRRNFNVWEYAGATKTLVFQQFDTSGKSLFWIGTRTGIEPGTWYHIAAVISGTAVTIYVNGRADGTGTRGPGEAATSADPLTFGYGFHGHYPGLLDEIRLYNRALTAPEVQAIHARDK